MKVKIRGEFRPYRIPGGCNPSLAHQALSVEGNIGTMLPCNVIVQQHENGDIDVAAINPAASMANAGNPTLIEVAARAGQKLECVVSSF